MDGEYAVQGPALDDKTYGDYFTYYLFHYLERGRNLSVAFRSAAAGIRRLVPCKSCGYSTLAGAFNSS